jgi:hypothetical protein
MQTIHSVREILSRITFPNFTFQVFYNPGLYLQIESADKNNVTGEDYVWRSRKWQLSQHMTDSEIVQTAFKAVLTALEHEAREQFLYRGVSVFDPHYDVERLVELRRDPASISEREPMPTDKSFTGE